MRTREKTFVVMILSVVERLIDFFERFFYTSCGEEGLYVGISV